MHHSLWFWECGWGVLEVYPKGLRWCQSHRRKKYPQMTGWFQRYGVLLPREQGLNQHAALDRVDGNVVDKPGIILLMVDTLRADALRVYGQQAPTSPFLDRCPGMELYSQITYQILRGPERRGLLTDRSISQSARGT